MGESTRSLALLSQSYLSEEGEEDRRVSEEGEGVGSVFENDNANITVVEMDTSKNSDGDVRGEEEHNVEGGTILPPVGVEDKVMMEEQVRVYTIKTVTDGEGYLGNIISFQFEPSSPAEPQGDVGHKEVAGVDGGSDGNAGVEEEVNGVKMVPVVVGGDKVMEEEVTLADIPPCQGRDGDIISFQLGSSSKGESQLKVAHQGGGVTGDSDNGGELLKNNVTMNCPKSSDRVEIPLGPPSHPEKNSESKQSKRKSKESRFTYCDIKDALKKEELTTSRKLGANQLEEEATSDSDTDSCVVVDEDSEVFGESDTDEDEDEARSEGHNSSEVDEIEEITLDDSDPEDETPDKAPDTSHRSKVTATETSPRQVDTPVLTPQLAQALSAPSSSGSRRPQHPSKSNLILRKTLRRWDKFQSMFSYWQRFFQHVGKTRWIKRIPKKPLKQKVESHAKDNYKCPFCFEIYSEANGLIEHLPKHKGEYQERRSPSKTDCKAETSSSIVSNQADINAQSNCNQQTSQVDFTEDTNNAIETGYAMEIQDDKRMYKCAECGESIEPSQLEEHENHMHPPTSWTTLETMTFEEPLTSSSGLNSPRKPTDLRSRPLTSKEHPEMPPILDSKDSTQPKSAPEKLLTSNVKGSSIHTQKSVAEKPLTQQERSVSEKPLTPNSKDFTQPEKPLASNPKDSTQSQKSVPEKSLASNKDFNEPESSVSEKPLTSSKDSIIPEKSLISNSKDSTQPEKPLASNLKDSTQPDKPVPEKPLASNFKDSPQPEKPLTSKKDSTQPEISVSEKPLPSTKDFIQLKTPLTSNPKDFTQPEKPLTSNPKDSPQQAKSSSSSVLKVSTKPEMSLTSALPALLPITDPVNYPSAKKIAMQRGRKKNVQPIQTPSTHPLAHSCNICGKEFARKSKLIAHTQWKHSQKSRPAVDKSVQPRLKREVAMLSNSQASTSRHGNSIHEEELTKIELPAASPPEIGDGNLGMKSSRNSHSNNSEDLRMRTHEDKQKPFKCEQCDFSSRQKANLQAHKRFHDPTLPWKCSECSLRFRTKSSRKIHEARMHKKRDVRTPGRVLENVKHNDTLSFTKSEEKERVQNVEPRRRGRPLKSNSVSENKKVELPAPAATANSRSKTSPGNNPVMKEVERKSEIAPIVPASETGKLESKRYLCYICGKAFSSENAKTLHLSDHKPIPVNSKRRTVAQSDGVVGDGTSKCDTCGKSFSNVHSKLIHMRTHLDQKPFKCTRCDNSFRQIANLQVHEKYHDPDPSRPWKCNICSCYFKSKFSLGVHANIHKNGVGIRQTARLKNKRSTTKSFSVKIKKDLPKLNISSVVLTRCDDLLASSIPSETAAAKVSNNKHIKADNEKKNCTSPAVLQPSPISTLDVGLKSTKPKEVNAVGPLFTQVQNGNSCPKCPKQFSHAWNLRRHLLTHEKPRKVSNRTTEANWKDIFYRCEDCSKTFPTYWKLKRHLLTHKKQKQRTRPKQEEPIVKPEVQNEHKCSICLATFTNRSNLNRHVRTHPKPKQESDSVTPEVAVVAQVQKKHSCSKCSKSFGHSWVLKRHLLTHTKPKQEDKPGTQIQNNRSCTKCPKTFANPWSLKRHYLVVHATGKPFKCPTCSKVFPLEWNLNRHMRIHSEAKPYKCKNCSMAYRHPESLKKHTLSAHKKG